MTQKKWIAFLLSLFVCPGSGHLYLGQKKKGTLLSLIVCGLVLILAVLFEWEFVKRSQELPNTQTLLFSVSRLAKEAWLAHVKLYLSGLIAMGVVWLYAAWDIVKVEPGPKGR